MVLSEELIKNIPLAILTGLGAYGGFPQPPRWFVKLSLYRLFNFIILWVLIFQGGGGQSPRLTTVVAISIYLIMEGTKVAETTYHKMNPGPTKKPEINNDEVIQDLQQQLSQITQKLRQRQQQQQKQQQQQIQKEQYSEDYS